MKVTVRLFGSPAPEIRTQTLQLELRAGATARELLQRLEEELAVGQLAERLAEHCLVVVNGTDVEHLGGWETPLPEGAVVGIVPAAVGG